MSSSLLNPSAAAACSHSERISRPTPRRAKAGFVYIARTRAGSAEGSSSSGSRPGVLVTAVQRRASTPATTASDLPVTLNDEVGVVLHPLRVDTHDRPARLDLLRCQETLLEFADGGVHHHGQRLQVPQSRNAMGKYHPAILSPVTPSRKPCAC